MMPDQFQASQREGIRVGVAASLQANPPIEDEAVFLNEWIVVAAWVDANGKTWITRVGADDNMPDYRTDGLLRAALPATWDAI